MKGNLKEFDKEKRLFKSVYCRGCKQNKVCGKLDSSFCCFCQYQIEQEKVREYSSYQQVYQRKEQEKKRENSTTKIVKGLSRL